MHTMRILGSDDRPYHCLFRNDNGCKVLDRQSKVVQVPEQALDLQTTPDREQRLPLGDLKRQHQMVQRIAVKQILDLQTTHDRKQRIPLEGLKRQHRMVQRVAISNKNLAPEEIAQQPMSNKTVAPLYRGKPLTRIAQATHGPMRLVPILNYKQRI